MTSTVALGGRSLPSVRSAGRAIDILSPATKRSTTVSLLLADIFITLERKKLTMLNENTYFADHTIIKRVDTPWGDRCIEASYDGFDARLDGYKCVIVLDTVRPSAD